jgi:fructoselysine 3-epimerase
MMKLSLSSFLYFNYSLSDAIQHTAAAGYAGIDIWGGRPHAYRRDLDEAACQALRQLMDDEGLGVASFIPAQFRYPTNLCSPSDIIRSDSIAYIQDSIVTAAALGAPVVSVCPGHSLYDQSRDDARERLADSLHQVCSFAEQYSLVIAIEPADKYETDLLNTCSQALEMINPLGHDNLGVLLDNGHEYVVGASAAKAVTELGDRLFHVHLDDNLAQRDQHLVPGEGDFDFPEFIEALRLAKYDGFLGVELGWDYTIDPDPAAQSTMAFMTPLLRE